VRSGKRITSVACIGADGPFLKPLIAIPGKTINAEIVLIGLSSEKVAIYSQPKVLLIDPFSGPGMKTFSSSRLVSNAHVINKPGTSSS
jgi:hypothetical protein